jgi:hypothetical protein
MQLPSLVDQASYYLLLRRFAEDQQIVCSCRNGFFCIPRACGHDLPIPQQLGACVQENRVVSHDQD